MHVIKGFEKEVYSRLIDFLEDNKIVFENQFSLKP